jgi:hypothetical protein
MLAHGRFGSCAQPYTAPLVAIIERCTFFSVRRGGGEQEENPPADLHTFWPVRVAKYARFWQGHLPKRTLLAGWFDKRNSFGNPGSNLERRSIFLLLASCTDMDSKKI